MENYTYLRIGEKVAFSYENGLFYSTNGIKRDKVYEIIDIEVRNQFWETNELGQSPTSSITVLNEKGKRVSIPTCDPSKLNGLKVYRNGVLEQLLKDNPDES